MNGGGLGTALVKNGGVLSVGGGRTFFPRECWLKYS